MKYAEALETIKYEVDEEGHCGYIENELRVAMTALEKQIPKRVIFGDDEQDDIYCPVCKFALATVDDREYESTFYKYCPHCSQKLEWSDTE